MHIRIIDAIQEQYGEKYPTLEDALNWWARALAARRMGQRFCDRYKDR